MLKGLIDILFPPSCLICGRVFVESICGICMDDIFFIKGPVCPVCGVPFSSASTGDHLCGECMAGKRPFSIVRSRALYRGTIVKAVCLLKYNARTSLATPLGQMMADIIDDDRYDIVTPIPLHKRRLKERGFNQALLLARVIAKRCNLLLDYRSLIRVKATAPQVELKRDERAGNMRGAFEVVKGSVFDKKRVMIVDDVYTTGATASECAKVIRKAGASEVGVFTLARAVNL